VQKTKYKILVLIILLSSVFTIDGYEFLHNHSSDDTGHCVSCLISSSLIAVDEDVSACTGTTIVPDFPICISVNSYHTEFNPAVVSDRAPPLS